MARSLGSLGKDWQSYASQSSHIPFAAVLAKRTSFGAKEIGEIGWRPVIIGFVLYLILLIAHEPVIGIAPVSLVSGLFN